MEVFQLGAWKSIKEMEEEITLDELYSILDSMRETEYSNKKFLAAMQGVDLEEGKRSDEFERVKQKAAAALAGKTEDEYVFNDVIGIDFETD